MLFLAALAAAAALPAPSGAAIAARLVQVDRALATPDALDADRLRALLRRRAELAAMLKAPAEDAAVSGAGGRALVARLAALPVPRAPSLPARYAAPVEGRLVDHAGAALRFATGGREAILAPAAGRVVFTGPYRGYGVVMILDHGGGWKTLLTGLGTSDRLVGDQLPVGTVVGHAPQGAATLGLELHRDGQPIDPIPLMAGR